MRRRSTIITILFVVVILLLVTGCIVMYNRQQTAGSAGQRKPAQVVQHSGEAAAGLGWLEIPAESSTDGHHHVLTHFADMNGEKCRNYTCFYDDSTMTSYWVAYPICQSHLGTGRTESWGFDNTIDKSRQTKVSSGYGVSLSTSHYAKNSYARGHQIPNADRNGVPEMMAQTYYSTNMTPQIQNGFNGHIWAKLEDAVRSAVPLTDTLYVVTGAAFQKNGEQQLEVKSIVNKNDKKSLPVPNYYWKVLLKVKRKGADIIDASAIGFWLPHDDLKESVYTDFTTSVDEIEKWTGFDFFANLSSDLQSKAEANKDWLSFRNY